MAEGQYFNKNSSTAVPSRNAQSPLEQIVRSEAKIRKVRRIFGTAKFLAKKIADRTIEVKNTQIYLQYFNKKGVIHEILLIKVLLSQLSHYQRITRALFTFC